MSASGDETASGPGTGEVSDPPRSPHDEAMSESDISSSGDQIRGSGYRTENNPGKHSNTAEASVNVVHTEQVHIVGLDDLSTAVNSLDDHMQARLQEVRSCLARLKQERTQLLQHIQSLTQQVQAVTAQRETYQQSVAELHEEVHATRKQLKLQQQDNEVLTKKIQDIQEAEERHLESLAGKARHRRLAHSAIVKWRRKVLDKGQYHRMHLQDLEEENLQLRAELLQCQEAAKQAFLRSANALNSEAITMFQDAATRRLGLDDNGSISPDSSTSSDSPMLHPQRNTDPAGDDQVKQKRSEEQGNEGRTSCDRDVQADEETVPPYQKNGLYRKSYTVPSRSRGQQNQQESSTHFYSHMRGAERQEDGEQHSEDTGANRGFSHHILQQQRAEVGPHPVHSRRPTAWRDTQIGTIPKPRQTVSEFAPETLRQETRTCLQQLREDQLSRSAQASTFEPVRKTMKTTIPSRPGAIHRATCNCVKNPTTSATAPATYKCPYCSPIQVSSLHYGKNNVKKGEKNVYQAGNEQLSNLSRSIMLSGLSQEKRRTVYTPSASTVVIEKHLPK